MLIVGGAYRLAHNMALSDNRGHRLLMLCAMYVAQGIPWGFMTIALISYLADRGLGDGEAGKLTAIVLVPWTFKLIWGPLIDSVTIRSMGRRRPWILGAEFLMALSLLGLLTMGDLTQDLRLLGWMFFIHNCFATLQDVSTDGLALDVVPPSEQGQTNGWMWGSKLIGKGIGGAVMAMVIDAWSLSGAVLLQFIILLLIMLFPLILLERPGEKRLPWSRGQAQGAGSGSSLRSPIRVLRDLRQGFSMVTTSVFLVFSTICMIGWGIVEVITKTLYTQQLDWSFVEVSKVSGAAVFVELFGALAGGYLADRFGRRKVMVFGLGGYGLLAILFGVYASLWTKEWFAAGYLLLNPGLLAAGLVGALAMAMKISWTRAAATMFITLLTVANIGHVIGNWLVGPLREQAALSYEQTFWFAGLAMIVPLFLLLFVKPEQVDRMREIGRNTSHGRKNRRVETIG